MTQTSFFPESFIAQVKDSVNIVQVISEVVSLKKSGRNFQGLCPFHADKNPSFTVSEEKQMFHCFGCRLGGNVFTFLMHYHHLTFPEAVAELAQRLGIPLPQGSSSEGAEAGREVKEALRRIHQAAAEYFHRILTREKIGKKGWDYLSSRKMTPEIVREFFLGYAPEGWNHFLSFAERHRFPLSLLEQSGLVIKKEKGGHYDRFRNRLLFPIQDEQKRVIGFGGRALSGETPKYLNSPETPLFNKSRVLYGLPQALPAIRKLNQVIIVEGYFDLLTLHLHGFTQTVATMGTALTPYQVRKLKGLAEDLILLYDGDAAGLQAALKTVSLFRQEGVSARIKVLPPETDPDGYCFQVGAKRLAAELAEAEPMMTFFFNQQLRNMGRNPQDQARMVERLTPHLLALDSEVERAHYVSWLSNRLRISETVLWRSLKASPTVGAGKHKVQRLLQEEKVFGLDWHILGALLCLPQAAPLLMAEDPGEILESEESKAIYQLIREAYLQEGRVNPGRLLDRIENQEWKNRIAALVVRETVEEKDAETFLFDLSKRIRLKRLALQEQALSREIRAREKAGVNGELKSLLMRKKELLNQRKELIISSKGTIKESL